MTENKKNPGRFLPECMEQRLILLNHILNLTKEIEVQSRQQMVDIGTLVDKRQVYIDRLKKCNAMIDAVCREFPPEQCERMKKIVAGKLPQTECTEEEKKLCELAQKENEVLQKILALDREARSRLEAECNRIQARLRELQEPLPKSNRRIY
ncbi:hypothetical protein [Thermocaproicibacter melissae]|uniref:hypothetical protein n=1 Tax=Thermocaproicibacter melissae TaxID=2966552 RepID=UPI0024B123B8|nr:hypothetical protein [Thermocaproicibacter melissae]WBY64338.1 hypothetical protein NOG13_01085 [Thermocaproicibacter melissae]